MSSATGNSEDKVEHDGGEEEIEADVKEDRYIVHLRGLKDRVRDQPVTITIGANVPMRRIYEAIAELEDDDGRKPYILDSDYDESRVSPPGKLFGSEKEGEVVIVQEEWGGQN